MQTCSFPVSRCHFETIVFIADNLTVQWGVQDHYEIVRKVGRGKYSEVSPPILVRAYGPCLMKRCPCARSSSQSIFRPRRNASSKSSSPSRRRRSSEKSRFYRTLRVVRMLSRCWMLSGILRYATECFQQLPPKIAHLVITVQDSVDRLRIRQRQYVVVTDTHIR